MAGQYFWFICLGVWLLGLAVLRGRAGARGATDDQSRRDMNRAFATAVAVVVAVCVPLGVLQVLDGIRDPLCLLILPLTNAYVLASWVAVGLANAGILSWVWLGNGGQVLSVLGHAALRQPVSAVAMRRFVTGAVLWSVLFGVVGRTIIDPMPGYCDGQAGVGASVGGNVAGKQAARAISMRALFCAFLVLGVSSASQAAGRAPEEVIAAFFGPNGIQDKSSYYTGEMLAHFKDQPTLGQSLPPGVQVFTRPLPTSGALSVFGVTLAKKEATQDWYAYLSQDKGQWKLAAVRTLALTGIPLRVLQELQSKSQRTPDEEWTLQNLQLLFKSDAELRAFVLSNIQRLEKVVSLANAGQTNEALSAAKQIYLSAVHKTETGNIELSIGGIVDNSVGIVFVPDGARPPAISPSLYIYVEQVLEHWYVFKTT